MCLSNINSVDIMLELLLAKLIQIVVEHILKRPRLHPP